MRWLKIFWLIGVAFALGVFVAPPLRIALLVGSALYLIAVVVFCVAVARKLTANAQWMERQLGTVRYGTITERNAPIV